MDLTLPPELERKLTALAAEMPRFRYSPMVQALLVESNLITEIEVAELRGEMVSSTQQRRSRGQMPAHFKWGNLICYDRSDIARDILAGRVDRRDTGAAADLLGKRRA